MRRIALALLALLCLASARPAHAHTPVQPLCAAHETSNIPRPVPESLAATVNATFGTSMPAQMAASTSVYRCAGGQLMLCTTGANLPCGKADTSRTQGTGARAWCKQNPNTDFTPAYATGHDTIFAWRCADGAPKIEKPIFNVDAQGFITQFWRPAKSS